MVATITELVESEIQPEFDSTKTNFADPRLTPVTTPPLVTLATAGLLLVQIPPEAGCKVVILPIQMDDVPVILTGGFRYTKMGMEFREVQPVVLLVNLNVAVP